MPTRNQVIIRRDINRLKDTIERTKENNPALSAILPTVTAICDKVNQTWQEFQKIAVQGDKEREERDESIDILVKWIQRWRPVIMLTVPGADQNLKKLPSSGATPDDIIRVAEDMIEFMNAKSEASSFRVAANNDLGDALTNVKKETIEATAILQSKKIFINCCTEFNNKKNNNLLKKTEELYYNSNRIIFFIIYNRKEKTLWKKY